MKRTLCLAVLLLGLLGHRGPAAADSGGAEGVMATEPGPPAETEALWEVLDKCVEAPPLAADAEHDFEDVSPQRQECGEAARTVASAGSDADRERLWVVFDALPESSPMVEDVLDAFLDLRVEQALAALGDARAPAPVEPVASDTRMPAFLQGASGDLQQAWRLYQSVEQSQSKLFEPATPDATIAFQSHVPAFRRAITAFLRGRLSPTQAVAELSRHQWAGWCGTGSGILYVPKAKALLIAYLQIGRVDLALAASGVLTGRFMGVEGPATASDPRLLAAAGIDSERYYLGGVLSGRADLAVPLAHHGSEKAARMLLAGTRFLAAAGEEKASSDETQAPDLESLFWPLAALVEPGENAADPGWSSSAEVGPRPPEAEPIGADVQEDVLGLFAQFVAPGTGRREAETASTLLARLARAESRPAFEAMLKSPFGQVRQHGAAGLRALGETVADPLPSRPVSFRLVVDGRPLRSTALSLTLEKEGGESESTGTQTDDAGVVALERDSFVDPRRRVVSIQLGVRDLDSPEREWFEIKPESLPDLDAITTVFIRTGALTVLIPSSLLDGSPPPTLTLFAVRDGHAEDRQGEDFETTPIAVDLPVASTHVVFSHLQHGRYRVWLDRRGTIHESPVVEVGEEPVKTTVDVDPIYGTDDQPEDRAASPTNQPL